MASRRCPSCSTACSRRNAPDTRKALIQKLGQHGFAAAVRIGAQAATAERRRVLLLGLAAAISTTESPDVRLKLKAEKADRVNAPRSSWSVFMPSQHLNVIEVARLSGWPISDRDEQFPGQPPRHPRPVRPSAALQSGERVVATASAPGSQAVLGYNLTDALRHTWVIGPNGVGKSTLLLNLIVQDLEANRPVVVIEPKDLIADLLARIPEHRRDDIVVLDPFDEAPVGINPLDTARQAAHQKSSPTACSAPSKRSRATAWDRAAPTFCATASMSWRGATTRRWSCCRCC